MHLQKQIGEGSFGKVYLAKWRETTVAVKVLTGGNIQDDDAAHASIPSHVMKSLEKVRDHDSVSHRKLAVSLLIVLAALIQTSMHMLKRVLCHSMIPLQDAQFPLE